MSSGSSPRRKEQRTPLFEVQEKPLPKQPQPIDTMLDPFEDLQVAPRGAQRAAPRLRTEGPAPLSLPMEEPAPPSAPARTAPATSIKSEPAFSGQPAFYPQIFARQPVYEAYPHWDAPLALARRRPWLLAAVALVCGVILLWMYSASPKTFISTYGGLGEAAGSRLGKVFAPPRTAADVPSGEHSVLGQPSITATMINKILAQYGSPATGTGPAWIAVGERYGIDPAYALAFFIHESSAGTNPGWAGLKSDGSSTHNVGNIICAGYATCYGRFRDYTSWEEGIDDWYKLIDNEYVNGRGAQTLEQIIPIYAPSSDNNDVPGYIQAVVNMVDSWRQGVIQ
jgi:hypothetical protein